MWYLADERSKLIIQSLENSLNDILYKQSDEKYLWKFDPVKAEKTCFFIETLRHVKGKWGSQKAHIILEPWQCDNIFGSLIRSKLKRLVFSLKRSDTSKASGAVRKHT